MVGCVRIASRKTVEGSPPSIAVCTAARTFPASGSRPEQERLEAPEEHRIPADGHRPKAIAVVAALEAHEPRPPRLPLVAPILVGHLQRDLHGRAAVVGEEHPAALPGGSAQ